MLRYRLLSASILIPLIVGPVILGGPFFFALVLVALLITGYEFYAMAQQAGYHPDLIFGLTLIVLLLFDVYFGAQRLREILMAGTVVTLLVALFRRYEGWILGWALTFAGVMYIGVVGIHFVLLRSLPRGEVWTLIVLLATWATDTTAYIAGHRWGKHGFFTSISPKKTWEGAIGGVVAAVITTTVLGILLELAPWHAVILGMIVGIAGTAGDLAESVIKRQFGAKDSGMIVPGHGGLLDRADSLLFAAVFAYYYLVWIVRV